MEEKAFLEVIEPNELTESGNIEVADGFVRQQGGVGRSTCRFEVEGSQIGEHGSSVEVTLRTLLKYFDFTDSAKFRRVFCSAVAGILELCTDFDLCLGLDFGYLSLRNHST